MPQILTFFTRIKFGSQIFSLWVELDSCAKKWASVASVVGATLCQNEAKVKFHMEIDHHILFCEWDLGVNVHLKFYICLILAEGHNNCSFQGLIIVIHIVAKAIKGAIRAEPLMIQGGMEKGENNFLLIDTFEESIPQRRFYFFFNLYCTAIIVLY